MRLSKHLYYDIFRQFLTLRNYFLFKQTFSYGFFFRIISFTCSIIFIIIFPNTRRRNSILYFPCHLSSYISKDKYSGPFLEGFAVLTPFGWVIILINSLMVLEGVVFSNIFMNSTIASPTKLKTPSKTIKSSNPSKLLYITNKDLKFLLTPASTDFCTSHFRLEKKLFWMFALSCSIIKRLFNLSL